MIEKIDLIKPKVCSIDENYNGGEISNYRYYLNFPLQFFDGIPLNILLSKSYIYRKIFIRNDTVRLLKDICFYLIPNKIAFEQYNDKYQFYLTKSIDENDIEKNIFKSSSYGILNLYKNTSLNDKIIYLLKPKKEVNIKITKNLKNIPIVIYNKITNNIEEENFIIDYKNINIFGDEFYMCFLKYPLQNNYDVLQHKVSLGIYKDSLNIKEYYPIWVGIDLYDYINNYLIDFNLVITYNKEILILENI